MADTAVLSVPSSFNSQTTPIGARKVDPKTDIEWIRVKNGTGIDGGAWRPVSDQLLQAHEEAVAASGNGNGKSESATSESEESAVATATEAEATGGRRRSRAAKSGAKRGAKNGAKRGSGYVEVEKEETAPARRAKRGTKAAAPARNAKRGTKTAARPAKAATRAKRASGEGSGDTFTHCKRCGYEFPMPRRSGVCNSEAACAQRRKDKSHDARRGAK